MDVTLAAAMQLRTMLRGAGVTGMPGVRVRADAAAERPATVELTIEDRAEPGDEVTEARGIRFFVDDRTAAAVGDMMIDLDGQAFVVRPRPPH